MLNEHSLPSIAHPAGGSRARDPGDRKVVYWHRELPPLHADPAGEYLVEATSMRVTGSLVHRGELWDQCYQDLMARLQQRVCQEVQRLGGDDAHVLDEAIDSRRDDCSGEVWLRGRLKYLLLRRPAGT